MGYISERWARLEAQLVNVQAQIDALNTAILGAVASPNKSYMFDSGEGSHKTVRRSLVDMQKMLSGLYATESHLINELSRMGLVSIKLRRKS